MKTPQSPPSIDTLLDDLARDPERSLGIFTSGRPVDAKGRYLHWDELRWRTPPEGLTSETWWLGTALARQAVSRVIPLSDIEGQPFRFCNIDRVQEMVHGIDQQASGHVLVDEAVTSPHTRDRYIVSSLIEEAITSSQLEGASTTRHVAKEMLRTGRRPRDRSERMILNNFEAIQAIEELASGDTPRTPTDVLELHRVITRGTLDDERDAGRLQRPEDTRVAVHGRDDRVHHYPPPAEDLPRRLELLCDFANGDVGEGFIHPVVRAIVLHFGLAYDHPFADGNGRTARALFYWSMLRAGYWLVQYLSISSILRRAPARYERSYLYSETDGNDLTYFVLYQLEVIERALKGLDEYLKRKMEEQRQAERLLRDNPHLNHRQIALVSDAMRDPDAWFTIQEQERRHRVTYATARADLLGLEVLGLFSKTRIGKKFVFRPSAGLAARFSRPTIRQGTLL